MALYSLDGKQQKEIGKKDYWNEFKKFKYSPLYKKFIYEISRFIEDLETINSAHAGKHILSQITTETPELLESYPKSLLGSLFGMTLWNWLATNEGSWVFSRYSKAESNEASLTVYFKKKD